MTILVLGFDNNRHWQCLSLWQKMSVTILVILSRSIFIEFFLSPWQFLSFDELFHGNLFHWIFFWLFVLISQRSRCFWHLPFNWVKGETNPKNFDWSLTKIKTSGRLLKQNWQKSFQAEHESCQVHKHLNTPQTHSQLIHNSPLNSGTLSSLWSSSMPRVF